jgi:hypothetical protein
MRTQIALIVLICIVGAFMIWPFTKKAAPAAAAPVPNPYDGMFSVNLNVGEEQTIEGVTLRFTEVLEDGRCPEGMDCYHAGWARIKASVNGTEVQFNLRGGHSPGRTYVAPSQSNTRKVAGRTIYLAALEPYPKKGSKPELSAYKATFFVKS